jgi:ubiquinone/menaquinone biosynthesis C-methylase UbiE
MRSNMTAGSDGWQLEGRSAAELYERYLVPTVTLPWALDLVERVGLRSGDRVLDVACGTGVVARVAAPAVGSGGRVAALDVNSGMLSVGRSLRRPAGAPIEWYEASALALPFGDDEFEVVLCQLGLQFLPDPPAALREMLRVLAPAGRVGASVYTSIDRNPAAQALSDALDRHLGEDASRAKRSEHSLADSAELHELFADAGFADVHVQAVTRTLRFSSADEWTGFQFAATPLASLLAEREPSERGHLVALVTADVDVSLAAYALADGLAFPQEVHVALATA